MHLEKNWTWDCDHLKTSNLSADNFKNTSPRWVNTWAHDTVIWYWSAGTLFWQLSIDQNIVSNKYALSVFLCSQTSKSMRLNIVRDLVKQLTGQRTASK